MITHCPRSPAQTVSLSGSKRLEAALNQEEQDTMTDRELIQMLVDVVEDFLPNIGMCALQDYGRLNTAMMEAKARLLRSKEDGE
jgi:hypothetical protein